MVLPRPRPKSRAPLSLKCGAPITSAPATARARARVSLTEEIKATARRHLTENVRQPCHLAQSTRACDGLVGGAPLLPQPGRLTTALLVDAVGEAADRALVSQPNNAVLRWRAVARAIRQEALAHPHDYALIYGSPVPATAPRPKPRRRASASSLSRSWPMAWRQARSTRRRPCPYHEPSTPTLLGSATPWRLAHRMRSSDGRCLCGQRCSERSATSCSATSTASSTATTSSSNTRCRAPPHTWLLGRPPVLIDGGTLRPCACHTLATTTTSARGHRRVSHGATRSIYGTDRDGNEPRSCGCLPGRTGRVGPTDAPWLPPGTQRPRTPPVSDPGQRR